MLAGNAIVKRRVRYEVLECAPCSRDILIGVAGQLDHFTTVQDLAVTVSIGPGLAHTGEYDAPIGVQDERRRHFLYVAEH